MSPRSFNKVVEGQIDAVGNSASFVLPQRGAVRKIMSLAHRAPFE